MNKDDDWLDIYEDWQVLYGNSQNQHHIHSIHPQKNRNNSTMSEQGTRTSAASSDCFSSSASEPSRMEYVKTVPVYRKKKKHSSVSIRTKIRTVVILFLFLCDLLFIYVIIQAFLLTI